MPGALRLVGVLVLPGREQPERAPSTANSFSRMPPLRSVSTWSPRAMASQATCHSFSARRHAGADGSPQSPFDVVCRGRRAAARRSRRSGARDDRRRGRPTSRATRCADLVGEVRRRRPDQLVDVADSRLGHGCGSYPLAAPTMPARPARQRRRCSTSSCRATTTARCRAARVRASWIEAAARAIRETDLHEAKLARTLLGMRTLGPSIRARCAGSPRSATARRASSRSARAPHEVVLGFVGQPVARRRAVRGARRRAQASSPTSRRRASRSRCPSAATPRPTGRCS